MIESYAGSKFTEIVTGRRVSYEYLESLRNMVQHRDAMCRLNTSEAYSAESMALLETTIPYFDTFVEATQIITDAFYKKDLYEWLEGVVLEALEDPATTEGFYCEEIRRGFWDKLGIYELFSPQGIVYINEVVLPTIAMKLVTGNVNGLRDFCQALEGRGVQVWSVKPEGWEFVELPEDAYLDCGETSNQEAVFSYFNGSTGSLGLLAKAIHKTEISGASAGFLESYLKLAAPVWEVPRHDDPVPEPPPGYVPAPQGGTVLRYRLKPRLTK